MKDSVKSLTARDSILAAAVVEMSLRYLAHNWVVAVRALRGNDATPLPAALVCRGTGRLLCREGQQRQQLAYVYFEDEPGRRSAAKLLTRDEARRIAANIAKLPELVVRVTPYRSNCNVTLTAMHRLKPSRNPNSHEGSITA
jgi:hypothetical protein